MTNKSLVQVGVITSAHGIRGQVKVRSFTNQPADITKLGVLSNAEGKRQFTLTSHSINDNQLIVSVAGISDRNAAELLKNTALYAPADKLPVKDRRDREIIGMEARSPDGNVYGKVIALYNFGAGDILEFERTGGKTEMLPFNENFIGEIDEKNGIMTVFPPEYVEDKNE